MTRVDVIVSALALEHVPSLDPVLGEFARVLRPGGDLIISDCHHELITRGSVMTGLGPEGQPWIAPTYRHQIGDYLRPALRHGLQVRRCEEPRWVDANEPAPEPTTEIGEWQDWPWSLIDYLPSAKRAAGGRPQPGHLALPATCPLTGLPPGPARRRQGMWVACRLRADPCQDPIVHDRRLLDVQEMAGVLDNLQL